MALSNWDCMAFGPSGSPCNGIFAMTGNARLEIYKNWCYINDEDAWVESHGMSKPCIMRIDEGVIEYAQTEITAVRHTGQDAIFVYAEHIEYEPERIETNFAGVGCYSYMTATDYIEMCKPELFSQFPDGWRTDYIAYTCYSNDDAVLEFVHSTETSEHPTVTIPLPKGEDFSPYIGVSPGTLSAFMEWLPTVCDNHEWIDKVKSAEKLRFNQGDAFFFDASKVATAVGEQANDTILGAMLGKE